MSTKKAAVGRGHHKTQKNCKCKKTPKLKCTTNQPLHQTGISYLPRKHATKNYIKLCRQWILLYYPLCVNL